MSRASILGRAIHASANQKFCAWFRRRTEQLKNVALNFTPAS
jgi:hypothetical protein